MIHLSNPVRLALVQEFASQFNAQLALACAPLGLVAFTINFTTTSVRNFWQAPIVLDFLIAYLEENRGSIPALCLYSDSLGASGRPGVVDGIVRISGAVFIAYDLDTTDFEAMPEAVQAAITGIIHESQTDNWGGGTYANDLSFRTGELVFDRGKLYRALQFSMSFQVTAN